MCVLLAAAEGEVAPRDVLEHVREVLHDGCAALAPARALALGAPMAHSGMNTPARAIHTAVRRGDVDATRQF